MSAAVPPEYAGISNGNNAFQIPFYLKGVALNIPLFRRGPKNEADTLELIRHPYNWTSGDSPGGGMMIYVQPGNLPLIEAWTGQVVDIANQPGQGRFVGHGVLRILRVDTQARNIGAQVVGQLYVPYEDGGRAIAEPFEITLNMELGY